MMRVFLLLSAFTVRPAQSDDVRYKESVLAEPRYRFCHEEDYPLIESERAFCQFIKEGDETCPALLKACKLEPKEVEESGGTPIEMKIEPGSRAPAGRKSGEDERVGVRRIKGGGDDKKGDKGGTSKQPDKGNGDEKEPNKSGDNAASKPPDTSANPKSADPPPPPPKPEPEASSTSIGLARILFFVLLAGFIAFIVRMIVKNVLADADAPPEDLPPDAAAPTAQTNVPVVSRGPIETDVERLLARARAAAQRGAFAQAIDDLYAALLRRLDGDGIINIQPFRTNGDYLREVRRERSEIAPDVRAILSDVESVHFGARSPSSELFSRIHDRVVPLVSKALAIAFFLFAVSGTTSCAHVAAQDVDETEDVITSDDSAFRGDSSPSGIHAIATLLEPVSVNMQQHRRLPEKLPDPGISTLVLLPDFDIGDIGERELRDWVKRGGHLVLAGGDVFPQWAGAQIDLSQMGAGNINPTESFLMGAGHLSIKLPPGPLVECADSTAMLERGSGSYACMRQEGDGYVFVFADDRWFMNIALPIQDNAAFLLSFFQATHHNVHVLDGQTSLGANSPIESIARSNLWPILIQLFLLLGLAFLWQGRAFGVLRDPMVERRRAFVDHVRALGLAYARSGASRHVLGIYAGWVIERLRERLPREGRRGLSGLAEALATRMGKSTGEVMTVLVDITDAQKEAAPMSQRSVHAPTRAPRKDRNQVAADFALFRALDQWLASTSRERRTSSSRSTDKKTKRSP